MGTSYPPSIRRAAQEAGLTPAEYVARQGGGHVSSGNATGDGTVFSPTIVQAAAQQGITPSQAQAQAETSFGGSVGPGLDAVAPVWDHITGDWYYVRAESIDGQQRLNNALNTTYFEGQGAATGAAYQAGLGGAQLQFNDMGVEYVPIVSMNEPTIGGRNQQEIREAQPVLPGTSMEVNFPGGNRPAGIVNPPSREVPESTTPAAAPSVKPPTGKARFRRRMNIGGLKSGGTGASTSPAFSLGGIDTNPLSIRRQE